MQSNLTDSDFWDGEWARFANHPALHRPMEFQPGYFGRDGVFTRRIASLAGPLAGRAVLEIGAGGPNLRLLALQRHLGARVWAIDFSPAGLAQLRQLFRCQSAPLEDAIAADFMTHDFGSQRFDRIVHWGVAEHITDLVPFLARSRALLADGGSVVFTMPNLEAIGGFAWRRYSPRDWSKHVLHPAPALARMAQAAGFRVTQDTYFGAPFLAPFETERGGPLASALVFAQRATGWAGRRLPRGIDLSSRRLAAERVVHLTPVVR